MNSSSRFGGAGPETNGGPSGGNRHSFNFGGFTGLGNPIYINANQENRDVNENGDRKSSVLAKEVQTFVPVFSGGRHESVAFEVNRFIESCQKLLDKASMGEKIELYQLFETRVQGQAYEKLSLNGANDFQKMKTILLRAYGPKKLFQEFMNEVQSCSQTQNETTTDYIERFEKRYRMACSAARAKYQVLAARESVLNELEQVAKHTFKRGVRNPVLHVHLLNMRKESIEEIIEEAEKFERENRIDSRDDNNRKSPTPDPSIMVITSEEQEDIRKIKRQMKDAEIRNRKMEDMLQQIIVQMGNAPSSNVNDSYRRPEYQNNQQRYQINTQLRYQNNGQRRDDYDGQRRDVSRKYDESANNSRTYMVECYRCGAPGHFARDCDNGRCLECKGTDHNFGLCIQSAKERRGEIPANGRSGN